MANACMDRDKWVEVFRATGLDEAAMKRWHQEFEQRYPDGHQAFLEWIQLPAKEISAIRANAGN